MRTGRRAIAVAGCVLAWAVASHAHDFGGGSGPGDAPQPPEDDPPCGAGPNEPSDPVDLATGAETFTEVDLRLVTRVPLRFDRTYDSVSEYDGPLGYGWDHAYNHRLYRLPDGAVIIRLPGGEKRKFLPTGGAFQPPADDPALELVDEGDGTYTMIDVRGVEIEFDVRGRPVRHVYKNLGSLELTYDPGGRLPLVGVPPNRAEEDLTPRLVALDYRLTRIAELDNSGVPTGHFIDLAYAADGRLTTLADHSGTTVGYTHDELGNLVRVDYDVELAFAYAYADPLDPHNLTTFEVSGSGCVRCAGTYTNTYDAEDRVVRQEHNGGSIDFDYVIPGVETHVTYTVTDAQGQVLSTATEVVQFDAAGNVTSMTDAFGHETVFVRDASGLPTRHEEWENVPGVGLVLVGSVDTTYDSQGRAISKVIDTRQGRVITEEYEYLFDSVTAYRVFAANDPTRVYGREYDYALDADGRPLQMTAMRRVVAVDAQGEPTAFHTTSFAYDAAGNLTRVVYPNGDTYVSEYDAVGRVTRRYNAADPDRDALFTYDARGFLATRTDPRGNVQSFQYDARGRLVEHVNALGETAVLTYDGLTLTRMESGIAGGQPGRVATYTYSSSLDPARLLEVRVDGQLVATYTYDSNGHRLSAVAADGIGTFYTYDLRGDLASVTQGEITVGYTYDSQHYLETYVDGVGGDVDYLLEHDFLGNRLSLQRPGQPPATYTYDAVDNMTSLTDPAGSTTTFIHDLESQLIEMQRPLSPAETFSWTSRGQIATKVDAGGRKIEYDYDPFGRLAEMRWFATAAATQPERTLSFSYDRNDNLLSYQDSVIAPGQDLSRFGYDELNRTATVASDLHGKSIAYTYDAAGRRSATVLTDGADTFTWSYAYDALGHVTAIDAPLAPGTTERYAFTYFPSGRLERATYPNGFTQSYGYHPSGRVASIVTSLPDDTELARKDFTHDAAGNVTAIAHLDGADTFAYDSLHRLTSASYGDGTSESFTYDALGNRLTHVTAAGTTSFTYDARNRMLSASGATSATFTYDDNGNLTTQAVAGEPTLSFGYDHFNRLISRSGDVTATYAYDPFNRRVTSVVDGVLTRYLYDGSDVLVEMDAAAATQVRYHQAVGVDDRVGRYRPPSGASEHYVSDHQASIEYLLDASGVANSYRYGAFGDLRVASEAVTNPYGYTGRRSGDEELYDYRARWYAPRWGRFLQEDPLRFSAGLNFYAYVRNNPLGAIDPFGLLTIVVPGTWWSEDDWNDSADFVRTVGETFGETPVILGKDVWSGANRDGARRTAAQALVDLINRKRKAGEPVNVVAHSHGGNVSAIASADVQMDVLVTLGTPVRSDYTFNHGNIGTHIQGYSRNDTVQINGDLDAWHFLYQFFTPPAGREVPGATNVDTGVDTGPLDSHTDLWRDTNVWRDSIVPELPPGTGCANGGGGDE